MCAVTVTDSLYTSGMLSVITRTGNVMATEVNKLGTTGDATVNSVTGPNGLLYLVNEYAVNGPWKFTLIGPGNNWTPQVLTITKLKNIYALVQNSTHIFCIDYDEHRVVMIEKQGWTEVAWYDFTPSEAGYQAFGVGLCTMGRYVVSLFNECNAPWTTADYLSGKVVVLDPDAVSGTSLPPVAVDFGGQPKTVIDVGKNATSIVPFVASTENVLMYVPSIGGKQKMNAGNGNESRLHEISITEDPLTGDLSGSVAVRLVGSTVPADFSNLDYRHITFKENGDAYLMVANVYDYNMSNYKTQMVWQVYQTTVGTLQNLSDQDVVSALGSPEIFNAAPCDEGFLWDIVYDNGNDWLWMGHGDSVYIYDRGANASWTPTQIFSQYDSVDPTHSLNIEANANGNLNSWDVTAESQRAMQSRILRGVQPHGMSSNSPEWRAYVISQKKKGA
jgi:hypothetical protein